MINVSVHKKPRAADHFWRVLLPLLAQPIPKRRRSSHTLKSDNTRGLTRHRRPPAVSYLSNAERRRGCLSSTTDTRFCPPRLVPLQLCPSSASTPLCECSPVRLSTGVVHSALITHARGIGHEMPRLGFGVYLIPDASACLEAARAGYRHFDSAQYYQNEAAVGQAMRECGAPRSELFVSACCSSCECAGLLNGAVATKVMPGTKGYKGTATGIDESIKKLGLGKCWAPSSYTCLLRLRLINGHPIQEQCFPPLASCRRLAPLVRFCMTHS
jgi:hypothetical protein